MKSIKTVAHRGLAGLYPENTILSFEKALEYNPDAIELDVQLTSDNIPIIFHDEELKRTTNSDGWIKDKTYAQLCELNANNGFDCLNQKIPTLYDYFDLIKGQNVITFVELKNSFIVYPEIEKIVHNVIEKYQREDTCVIYSANHFSVLDYRLKYPDSIICFPFDNWILEEPEYCERYDVHYTIPYYKSLTKEIINDFHKCDVKVFPWTIDSEDEMKKMLLDGADGILTNRIDILTKIK